MKRFNFSHSQRCCNILMHYHPFYLQQGGYFFPCVCSWFVGLFIFRIMQKTKWVFTKLGERIGPGSGKEPLNIWVDADPVFIFFIFTVFYDFIMKLTSHRDPGQTGVWTTSHLAVWRRTTHAFTVQYTVWYKWTCQKCSTNFIQQ